MLTRKDNTARAVRSRLGVAVVLVLFGAALLHLTSRPAVSASSSTVVSVTVPSAITLTNGCTQQPAWGLGIVQPGSTATTATDGNVCRFDFQSSNDSAQLRIGQSDGTGTAMTGAPSVVAQGVNSAGHFSISAGAGTTAFASWPMSKSTDSGASWSGAGLGVGPQWLAAATSTLAYGFSWPDEMSRTTDGGATWNSISNPHVGWADLAPARGTNVIWSYSSTTLSRSADQGDTWSSQTAAVVAGGVVDIHEVQALSATTAVLYGQRADTSYAVLISTDSGVTWTATASDPVGSYWNGTLSAISTAVIWLRTGDSVVTRTIDGGATWSAPVEVPHNSSEGDSGHGMLGLDGNVAMHWDGGDLLYRTADGGATWTRIDSPSNNAVSGMDRFAGGALIAATSRQRILRSTDAGLTWSIVKAGSPQMRGVSAVTGNVAFAVGSNGTVERTTDGSTWSVSTTDAYPALWSVAATSTTDAIAVGNGGAVVRTTDGTTWGSVASGLPGTTRLTGVSRAGSSAIAVGSGGTIIRSSDGGATWSTTPSGTAEHLWSVDHAPGDPTVVWAVGDADTVLRSTNSGASWAVVPSPGYGSDAVRMVAAVSASVAWVAGGNSGTVYRTTDGGTSWSAWNPSWLVQGLDAFDSRRAIAATRNGIIATYDGGTTSENLGDPGYNGVFDAVDMNTGWYVGTDDEFGKLQPGASVPDFGAAPNNWTGGPADGLFAMCVQDVALSGAITAPFVEDTVSTPGSCQAVAADPWAAIPTTSTKLATTAAAGQSGRVDLVWAMRAPTSQAPGEYSATITIEALAPNA